MHLQQQAQLSLLAYQLRDARRRKNQFDKREED